MGIGASEVKRSIIIQATSGNEQWVGCCNGTGSIVFCRRSTQ